ncbi:MAG: bifunctional demethylmenaquinone methyltransferase/2-methoxy-6-polyprenyl-1,4-benzoquinol methylase UbiE [Vicinamibacteraceae bacterium]|nr:bifunctional demethylmenaquinone methyltransferase/2-methoxy-6-polyprenyl-1,4-benzoquinol methylase UbiE [Vicinamibacteraceae bacterium]
MTPPAAGARSEAARATPLGEDKRPEKIARMFDAIARRYDLLNHVLSGGLDLVWRRRAIRELRLSGRDTVVDVCTGTCDFALAAVRPPAAPGRAGRVIGIDFAPEMLRVGQAKLAHAGLDARVPLLRGDAMRLPLADRSADAVTVAFGIRNVFDPTVALGEFGRILKPGGRVAILEFALPRTPIVRAAYLWYFRHVLPRIGRLVSRHAEAYTYLPASVGSFHEPATFAAMLERAGFEHVRPIRLTFGVVYLYVATRAAATG